MSTAASHLQMYYTWHSQYYNHLMMIGLRFGRQQEELKDAINQMFLDLIEKKTDLSVISNPGAFLTTTFKRRLIDASRKSKRTARLYEVLMTENVQELSVQEKLEENEQLAELVKRLRALYENLPPRCRKVIYLKFYEGLTTQQIMERTGLSSRSVYNNLFEGIKLLRAEMVKTPALESLPQLSVLICCVLSINSL